MCLKFTALATLAQDSPRRKTGGLTFGELWANSRQTTSVWAQTRGGELHRRRDATEAYIFHEHFTFLDDFLDRV
jgi:hypothetical protein